MKQGILKHGIMKISAMSFVPYVILLAAVAVLLAAGFATEPPKAVGRLDTPEHHTLRGHDFIDKGRWDDAERSFDFAISLGKDHGPAYAGKAIVVAHEAAKPGLSEDQREDFAEKADDLLDEALKYSKNEDEERAAHTAGIRVFRLTKLPRDWLSEAADHYEDAVDLDSRQIDPDPHFYMARAYRDAFAMKKAEDLYRKVLGMNTSKTGQADAELSVVQKIIRAEPGSRHGRVIAFADSISLRTAAGHHERRGARRARATAIRGRSGVHQHARLVRRGGGVVDHGRARPGQSLAQRDLSRREDFPAGPL